MVMEHMALVINARLSKVAGHRQTFAAAYFPPKKTTSKHCQMILCSIPCFAHQTCQMPSHSQEILSFIQAKQNKI
jgi:hypothetical protein